MVLPSPHPKPTKPPQEPSGEGMDNIPRYIMVYIALGAIISIILFLILWAAIVILMDDGDYIHTTVNIAPPQVSTRDVDGVVYHEAVLNINKITPRDDRIVWSDLNIVVRTADGTLLLAPTVPRPDDTFLAYMGSEIDVHLWYVETGGNNRMDAGDALRITGMTLEFQGATIELFVSGDSIGSTVLPTNFP